jgi:hypothetical protein
LYSAFKLLEVERMIRKLKAKLMHQCILRVATCPHDLPDVIERVWSYGVNFAQPML